MSEPPVEYIELNLSNFNDDDVSQLNEWGIWAAGRIETLENDAYGIQWWKDYTTNENERSHLANVVIPKKQAHINELEAKLSHRKCHDCGHVDFYTLEFLPYCKCAACASEDTRLIKKTK